MKQIILIIVLMISVSLGVNAEDYEVPRTPTGQPDFQGIWQAVNTAVWNIQDHSAELGIPAGQGVVVDNYLPYRPLALEQRQRNYQNRFKDDPEANCKMVGVPRITYMPYPFQIIQTEEQIVMVYEWVHTIRNILIAFFLMTLVIYINQIFLTFRLLEMCLKYCYYPLIKI